MIKLAVSLVAKLFSAIWQPVAALFYARERTNRKDAQRANEIRKAGAQARNKHDEDIPDLSDDELDQRLRDLRRRK